MSSSNNNNNNNNNGRSHNCYVVPVVGPSAAGSKIPIPSGDTDPPRPMPHAIQAARPLFVVQPLRLLAFHLVLLLATYLPLEPRTALAIVRLLSALQVISVVDGLFRYLRWTN
jgi:hypothetical protein